MLTSLQFKDLQRRYPSPTAYPPLALIKHSDNGGGKGEYCVLGAFFFQLEYTQGSVLHGGFCDTGFPTEDEATEAIQDWYGDIINEFDGDPQFLGKALAEIITQNDLGHYAKAWALLRDLTVRERKVDG